MKTAVIDLRKYTDRHVGVLAGRERGEFVRRDAEIDSLDADPDTIVEVSIPEWVFSVNSSFILGMLALSVRALTPPVFRKRYRFVGPNGERVFEELIRKAMLTGTPLAHSA